MGEHTILIPESLYEKAQKLAQRTEQPVEDIIRTRLEGALDEPSLDLPYDERAELRAMDYLSDDALFNMMREQMQHTKQKRMSALMERNSRGDIAEDEYEELAKLVEDGQRLTLRKAEAMRILMDRGYNLHLDDMMPIDG